MSLVIEGWMPSVRSSSMSSFGFVTSVRAMPDRTFGHGSYPPFATFCSGFDERVLSGGLWGLEAA
jgi:hypothetical protein